jgi:hypothetical protein
MRYFHDKFTTPQSSAGFPLKLTTSDGVSNTCFRETFSSSIEDKKLKFSLTSPGSGGPFLEYIFSSPYPTFPPMTISTTVSPKTTNTYSLEYIASNKPGTVKGKIVGNSLSFELDELTNVKGFSFYVSNENGVSSFTLTGLIGGSTRIPVPIKQVRKPRRRHEIIGASKISFPLAQHQSE